MDYHELWNYLVNEYSRNRTESEDKIHTLWQSYLSNPFMFGYSEIDDVDSKRSLHIGSTDREIPDLILRKNGNDLFVIELKRYALPKTDAFEKQLVNYMGHTDLRLSVGILVCEKLYIYYHDFSANKTDSLEIPFKKDNPSGEEFLELFNKQNFDTERIRDFIYSISNSQKNIAKIKNEMTVDLIKNLLKNHFISMYSEKDIETAFSEMNIIAQEKFLVFENTLSIHAEDIEKAAYVPITQDGKVSVTLNGITLPIYRSSSMSVQDFVKQTLQTLFDNNLLSDEEIFRLQTDDYCKNTFGIQFPLLKMDWKDCVIEGHSRYWGDSPNKKIGGFYVCSQWWKQNFKIYEEKIADWLKKLEKTSSKNL